MELYLQFIEYNFINCQYIQTLYVAYLHFNRDCFNFRDYYFDTKFYSVFS